MKQANLKKILDAHREWMESGGAKGSRADLSRANLSGANLYGADLYGADLSRANLSRANLSGANLSGANLSRANLSGANLYGANLSRADLYGADLSRADLYGADLSRADLSCANLSGATGFDPDEHRAAFWIIPEVGAFVGWKKLQDGVVAKIQIPDRAKRTASIRGRKCRAEYVKTLALYKDGKPFKGVGIGLHDNGTKYEVGKITRPDKYDDSPLIECSNGIHFFVCRSEAEAWST